MAFWCRIKQSQLKTLSNQFKRCYFQIHGPCSVTRTSSHTIIRALDKYQAIAGEIDLRNSVRFFAAPVQFRPKHEENDSEGPRLNEQITAQFIRLVTDEGHGVVSRHEALERARRLKLDLVEVVRADKPPVCKLMDYNKEMYIRRLKEKERIKNKSAVSLRHGECKEVRFAVKIEQKDLKMKAAMAKRLMDQGYKVKCMAVGTEDQDLAGVLSRLFPLIEDDCVVESGPRVEKRQAYVIVRHIKFGPSKKGKAQKLSSVDFTSTSSPTTDQSTELEEDLDAAESGLGTEDAILTEEERSSPLLRIPISTRTHVGSSSPTEASKGSDNRYKKDPSNRYQPTNQTNNGPGMRNSGRLESGFPIQGRQPRFDPNTSSPSWETNRVHANKFPNREVSRPSSPQGVPENRYSKATNPSSTASNADGRGRPDVSRGDERHGAFRTEPPNVIPNRYTETRGKVQK